MCEVEVCGHVLQLITSVPFSFCWSALLPLGSKGTSKQWWARHKGERKRAPPGARWQGLKGARWQGLKGAGWEGLKGTRWQGLKGARWEGLKGAGWLGGAFILVVLVYTSQKMFVSDVLTTFSWPSSVKGMSKLNWLM